MTVADDRGLADLAAHLDGMTLAEYLNQGQVWMSKNGPFLINRMDDIYARRCLHFLTRNVAEIFRFYCMEAYVEADHPPTLDTIISWVNTRPSVWIRDTPLFQAVQARTPAELT